MFFRAYLMVIAVGLTAAYGYSFFQEDPAAQRMLIFGDSLTAGYGLSKEEAFPAVLQKMIDDAGYPVRVINAGVSGDTSAGGLRRIHWVLRQPVDIFVLELGANDGLRGLPLEATTENLSAILTQVRAKNPKAKLVVAGMRIPPNLGRKYADQFEALFKKVADSHQAVYIPFLLEGVAGEKKLNLEDGIHPTPEGHQRIAAHIWPSLEPLLESVPK